MLIVSGTIIVIDRLRCANDGAGSSHGDGKSPFMTRV